MHGVAANYCCEQFSQKYRKAYYYFRPFDLAISHLQEKIIKYTVQKS